MKIKQIVFMLSMLGLVSSLLSQSPGTSNKSYKLTDDVNDSITAVADPTVYGLGTIIGESRFGMIIQFTESDLDTITGFNGTAAGRSGLFAITGGEWIYNESTFVHEYTASSAKLEPVEDLGDYAGAPLVADVHAEQIPGAKDVRVSFWLQYDEQKASKVFMEVWFRENSNEVQWQRCFQLSGLGLETVFGYNPVTGSNDLQVGHSNSQNTRFLDVEWNAGVEKPNFKGENCQIRVMAIYPKEDPYSPGTLLPDEQQGSGWDGFERESAPTFVWDNNSNALTINSQGYPEYDFVVNYVSSNSVPRIGSLLVDAQTNSYIPVWDFTSTHIEAITGTSGSPAGKYSIISIETAGEFGPTYETKLKAVIQQ